MSYKPSFFALFIENVKLLLHILFFKEKNFKVRSDKSALVILDPLDEYESIWHGRKALKKLIDQARDSNVSIIITRWARTASDPRDQLQSKGHWSTILPTRGTVMQDVLSWVGEDCPIVDVIFTDAWLNDTFTSLLQGKEEIVFAGMWTEACVLNTVRTTAYRNMKPIVCMDACAGHFPHSLHSLCAIQGVFGEVVKSVDFRSV